MPIHVIYLICLGYVMGVVYPVYAGRTPGKRKTVMTLLKGSGTLAIALTACCCALRSHDPASAGIAAGLLVCTAADVALNLFPLAGVALFLAGHCFYLGAFLRLAPFRPGWLAIFVLLYVVALSLFWDKVRRWGRKAIPYLFYGALLLLMLTAALPLPLRIGVRSIPAAAGAALFVLSDLMIAWGYVKGPFSRQSHWVMGLYYGAQLLFALTAMPVW